MSKQAADASRVEGVLATIGATIIHMQTAESAIATALTLALPNSSTRTVDQLTRETEVNNRATLGALLIKLRQRVDLDDDFSDVLEAFLRDRNDLIHDLSRVPGFGFSSETELAEAERFLANHFENTTVVTKAFVSLLVEWSKQIGSPHAKDERVLNFLGDFQGIARTLFFSKPSKQ